MAFKLAISNRILTKVKGAYTDENGANRFFQFQMDQDRIGQEELKATVGDKSEDAAAFVRRVTHGWRNQDLVLTEDNRPADFSPEALDMLLSISGMAGYCWQAYLTQVLVHEKN